MQALFFDTFINRVDAKGRVSVPAPFRRALAEQSFDGIVAYRSFTGPCLEGCGLAFMEQLAAGTDALPVFSEEREDLTALIFADASQLPCDSTGRIILPERFLEHAGIGEQAAFVGRGRSFQIWEPGALTAHQETLRQRAVQRRPTVPTGAAK